MRDTITLQPPVGGLNKAWSYQSQPPFTTVRCNNVRSFDVIEGRGRVGSRPGLVKAFPQRLGNVLLNGNFIADTNWTKGTGWTIVPNEYATAAGAISTDLSQTVAPLVAGGTYQVTFTITRTAGSITPVCGTTAGTARSASGTYTESITAAATGVFKFTTSGFTGTVDNVSATRTDVTVPIRLAAMVRSLSPTGARSFTDEFAGSAMSGTNWSHPSPAWELPAVAPAVGNLTSGGLPSVDNGRARSDATTIDDLRSAVLLDQSIAPTGPRSVTAVLGSSSFAVDGTNFDIVHLCMDMDATTPNPVTAGIRLRWSFSAAFTGSPSALQYAHSTRLYVNGTQQGDIIATITGGPPYQITLNIDSGNVVRASINGVVVHTYSSASYVPAGPRVGFAVQTQPAISGAISGGKIDSFAFVYLSSNAVSPRESVIFGAGGVLYREAPQGTLVVPSDISHGGLSIATNRRIHATSRLQSLYIADYELRAEGTAGTTDGAGTGFDDAAVADWTSLGISTLDDSVEIISGGSGATVGVYRITTIASGSLTLDSSAGINMTGISYRVVRCPKRYSIATSLIPMLERIGMGTIGTSQVPVGCRSVILWADRLVWCNNLAARHGWWMSAAGYPNLYDYGDSGLVGENGLTSDSPKLALGPAAAVAGTNSEFAGMIGEPIVTTIPINDDLLIFACNTSFYYLQGNPRLGGQIRNISREIGIIGIAAWCRTPDGKLIVLTPDGLYEITLQRAVPVSRDVIPQELLGLGEDRYEVSLEYDVARRGIRIAATRLDAVGMSIHYFYDLRTGGFFPDAHETGHDPTATVSYQPGGTETQVYVWGGRDGYVRKFSDVAEDDDGTGFASNVFLGPIRLGPNDDLEGIVHEFIGTLDALSGIVTVNFYVGDTPQAALASSPAFSCSLNAGRNYSEYPVLRGSVLYVELVGTPSSRWVYESSVLMREIVGKLRKS